MTTDDLTVNCDDLDRTQLLCDWEWLIGKKMPVLFTAAGDAFVQDLNDGTVHFLDVSNHELSMVADDLAQFNSLLCEREFVVPFLREVLIEEFRSHGLLLEARQVYSFKQPPLLGGKLEIGNMEACDIEVHFSVHGQIGEQIKDLPEGATVGAVRFSERPSRKPFWKFWSQ